MNCKTGSGGQVVAVMQITEPWHANRLGLHRSVLCSRSAHRRLLCQPKMCPVIMVVTHVLGHHASEMAFVEHDDMIEQISSATCHPTLSDAILPRAAKTGPLRLNAETLHRTDDLLIEVRGAVEEIGRAHV